MAKGSHLVCEAAFSLLDPVHHRCLELNCQVLLLLKAV